MTAKQTIEAGKAILGIEFGSTRIKAVLIDEDNNGTVFKTATQSSVRMFRSSTIARSKPLPPSVSLL